MYEGLRTLPSHFLLLLRDPWCRDPAHPEAGWIQEHDLAVGCRRYLPTRAHTELSVYELPPAAESVPILLVGFPQAGYA